MDWNTPKRALILAPHTDDGELGCGGTIAKFVEDGWDVHYVAFSICEDSVPEGFDPEALAGELTEATKILGVPRENLYILRHKVRRFNEVRQDILEYLVKLRNTLQPDWVFMPASSSLHQDHQVIYQEGLRAFKRFVCMGYDLPWDSHHFTTSAFHLLEERHVDKKIEALKQYKTQAHRGYVSPEFTRSLARVRGEQLHRQWAEAFEVLRLIF